MIGTPDQATARIEELLEQSNGGFGAYLTLIHNWANNQATAEQQLVAVDEPAQRYAFAGVRGVRWG